MKKSYILIALLAGTGLQPDTQAAEQAERAATTLTTLLTDSRQDDGHLSVGRNEKLVLQNGDIVDELTVYADAYARGQVTVDGGQARVKRLVLKYTFEPGVWNFISFPADLNLDRVSDLNQLGYRFNGAGKAYYLYEYSTASRAQQPEKSAWTPCSTPEVTRNKGYILGIARSDDNPTNQPVEITFTFENTLLGLTDAGTGTFSVGLDLTRVEPDSEVQVYITPLNVKGAPLKATLRYKPEDLAALPMSHERALSEARITFNPNRSGIRITLPTQEEARVVIFDSRNRAVKAVRYESPQLIPVTDLGAGTYQVYIRYGQATAIKEMTLD